ncbi:hypothetical protein ACMXYQ_06905 [Neptuniibacter sp. PT34_22]|uniref:hypothetical protein n=1 Tax=Neptuniibacter sp. PT34_22 TaxID=3398205 RepID=UPI0039F579CE
MKFIKVIILWLVSAFITYFVVNLVFWYSKPVPNFDELTRFQGEIVDYSLWRKSVGKGPRCGIVLSLDLGMKGRQNLRFGCSDKNKNLENKIGEEIQYWAQTDKWHVFGKDQLTIYHFLVGSDVLIDYEIKIQQDADSEPFRVIFVVLSIAMAVMSFVIALKETLHLFFGDGSKSSNASGKQLAKVSNRVSGDAQIQSVTYLKSKFPSPLQLVFAIGVLWYVSQILASI